MIKLKSLTKKAEVTGSEALFSIGSLRTWYFAFIDKKVFVKVSDVKLTESPILSQLFLTTVEVAVGHRGSTPRLRPEPPSPSLLPALP